MYNLLKVKPVYLKQNLMFIGTENSLKYWFFFLNIKHYVNLDGDFKNEKPKIWIFDIN
jgi:hypothetical protein